MPTEDVRRFACDEISGADLVAAYPKCACEATKPFDGGHGPIQDHEKLSFFVESKRHIDLSRKSQREKETWSPKGSDLRNATEGRGYSVYRLDYARLDELSQGARAGYNSATSPNKDEWRGIIGVFTFEAKVARQVPPGDCGQMCVIDTPKLGGCGDEISELSHADLLWSEARKDDGDDFLKRRRKFEDYIKNQLTKNSIFEFLDEFYHVDLTEFYPDYLKTG